jgi:hypothetical protein
MKIYFQEVENTYELKARLFSTTRTLATPQMTGETMERIRIRIAYLTSDILGDVVGVAVVVKKI